MIVPRPLSWTDLSRVHELALRRVTASRPVDRMYIGHFYWALRGADPLTDAWLWPREDGTLDAFAWLDPLHDDFIIAPDADPTVMPAVIEWLEARCHEQGRDEITMVALDSDLARLDALCQRGYAPGNDGHTRYWIDLEAGLDGSRLLEEFTIRHVATHEDLALRSAVESSLYGFKIDANVWRLFAERFPNYRADLDLVIVAPNGDGASALTAWYDPATRFGEIEAVGTVPEYRRRGLSRALVIECLHRLRGVGARDAVVQTMNSNESAKALYESCGFSIVGSEPTWTKRL